MESAVGMGALVVDHSGGAGGLGGEAEGALDVGLFARVPCDSLLFDS